MDPGATTDLAQLLAGLRGLAGGTPPRLVAVGWATVDSERTVADLGTAARVGGTDELLGARSWVIDSMPVRLVILEPNTEGRLAAALARRGEGIAALYVATGGRSRGATRLTALAVPGRLLQPDRSWGPFLIVVDGPYEPGPK